MKMKMFLAGALASVTGAMLPLSQALGQNQDARAIVTPARVAARVEKHKGKGKSSSFGKPCRIPFHPAYCSRGYLRHKAWKLARRTG
jgi:hypothetical protein